MCHTLHTALTNKVFPNQLASTAHAHPLNTRTSQHINNMRSYNGWRWRLPQHQNAKVWITSQLHTDVRLLKSNNCTACTQPKAVHYNCMLLTCRTCTWKKNVKKHTKNHWVYVSYTYTRIVVLDLLCVFHHRIIQCGLNKYVKIKSNWCVSTFMFGDSSRVYLHKQNTVLDTFIFINECAARMYLCLNCILFVGINYGIWGASFGLLKCMFSINI